MSQAYSNPERENDPHALPNVEIFYAVEGEFQIDPSHGDEGFNEAGWYYWFCFSGCLPDSEPIGPFASYNEALKDAQDNS